MNVFLITYSVIVTVALLVLLVLCIVIIDRKKESYSSGPATITDVKARQVPPANVVANMNLPNGVTILSCLGDQSRTFPRGWHYKNVTKGVVISVVLPRASGVVDNSREWSVSVSRAGDELLWFSNLVPGGKYQLSINDFKIPMTANSQGMIFPADIPFPVAAIPYADIRLTIFPGSTLDPGGKSPLVVSVPRDDYEVVTSDGITEINIDNTWYLSNCGPTTSVQVIGVYNLLTNDQRKKIAVTPINITFNGSHGAVKGVIRGGSIKFN